MNKVISGIKVAKEGAKPLYKFVLGFILVGVVVGIAGAVIQGRTGEIASGIGQLLNATALGLLTYNAKVNIKANNLAYFTGIFTLISIAAGVFYIL